MSENQKIDRPKEEDSVYKHLDGFPDPVILVDESKQTVFANEAAAGVIDVSAVGRELAISFRHPFALAAVDRVLEGKGEQKVEISVSVPIPRTFELYVKQVKLATEGDKGAIVVLHDITSMKSADQMRQDFVANVSHELRSPISSLVSIIETLQGNAQEDRAFRKKFLKIMGDEAARMSRLIDDLLSLSRVEITEHVPPDGSVDVRPILDEAIELLQGRASKKNILINILSENSALEIPGDHDELMEVFQNLIDNAIKYGDADSDIDISIERIERLPGSGRPGVGICFRNKGEGIESEQIPRLTERFYRADKARSRNTGGTGLGLAIVKHIVNRHRGELSIKSSPGHTTTFTVFLPLSR